MLVRIQNLSKAFDATAVLHDVSLEIHDREFFFLLGPSGCGKTTLLRLIAGFYQPDAGELWLGDRRMNGVEPHQRNTGMVFQNYALWPHLSVAQNVAYGLDVRRLDAREKKERVHEALRIVRMESFADRSPNQLSGGQQQRIALARALVIRPDVLLLDEPLSNLDARLRLEMRDEIRRIHDETRLTTIYVTHDQTEALSMADRIAVLRDGRIEQLDTPRAIYRNPANRFVADFVGQCNWLRGTVQYIASSELHVDTAAGPLVAQGSPANVQVGSVIDVGFRPESVRFSDGKESINAFNARVERARFRGDAEEYILALPSGESLQAVETNPREPHRRGTDVHIVVPPQDLFVLGAQPK